LVEETTNAREEAEEEEQETILLRAFVLGGQRLSERRERARENRMRGGGEWAAAPQR